jgi:SAM-dependent methyltransferase
MDSADWDARYASSDAVWSLEPNRWVARTVADLDPGNAVDLGAGEGRHALWLASLGWRVRAIDFSAVGLATGARRAAELGLDIEWVTADATNWVSRQRVDLVVIAYLQVRADQLARAIGNATEYLAPGGTLALVGHDRANTVGGPADALLRHTVEELREAASGLDIIECRELQRAAPNGIALDTVLLARAQPGR